MATPTRAPYLILTAPILTWTLSIQPTTTHAADPYTFDNLNLFQSQTAAIATAALPNVGLAAPQPFAVGDLSFSTPGAFAIFIGTGDGTQWTTLNAGHDIVISGLEELNIELAAPVTAFGFEFIEPQAGVPGFVDSTFTVELFDGITSVGTFTFQRPNDQLTHVAAASPAPFNRVEIRETTGASENEFFGQFYTANTNNKFWDNLNFGHWGTTTNWDPTGTPAPTDNVFITPNTTNDIGVFGPTTPTTIASLTIANTNPAKNTTLILETTGPLTLNGDLLVDQNGHLDIPTGATLSASGTNGITGTPPTNANNFTIEQGQLTLEGIANFNGGAGADSISGTVNGGDGAHAQQINFTNATVNIDDGTLNAIGGPGGDGFDDGSDRSDGGRGGRGGHLTLDDNATVNLTNTGAINLRGGVGGDAGAPFGAPDAGLGGNAGSLTLDTNASLTLNNATIDIRGGNGGGLNSLAGHAGNGGSVTLDNNADLTLTNATIDLSGGQGGPAGDGGNAGSLTAIQGDLSLTNATLHLNGGHGGPQHHPNGGHGGQLTITNGNHTIDNSTINLNGGNGIFHSILGGGGGNGGLININGGTTTLQNASTINLKPGTNGPTSPGAVNITAGTLNIDSALITANNTTPSPDPINIIAAPLTLSGIGTVDFNDNATLQTNTNVSADARLLANGNNGADGTIPSPNGEPGTPGHNITTNGNLTISGDAQAVLDGGDGGKGGSSSSVVGGDGAIGGTLSITDTSATLSDSATLSLNGGNGGISRGSGRGGIGASGGTIIINNTTTSISNSVTLNLNGGSGAEHENFLTTAPAGGVGGNMTITGGSTTISDTVALNLRGGSGGLHIDGGNGGPGGTGGSVDLLGGDFTMSGATINLRGGNGGRTGSSASFAGGPGAIGGTLSITDTSATLSGPAALNLDGGNGGNALNTAGGPGATGGTLSITNTTATISGSVTLDLNGGNGGNGSWASAGAGANGGTLSITDTTATLSDFATLNLNGGNGGANSYMGSGGAGASGGNVVTTNNATTSISNSVTLNLNGGNGGIHRDSFASAPAGGTGGNITIDGGSATISDTATVNLRGGAGSNHLGTGNGGPGGAGGTIDLLGGNLTMSGATVNLTGGAGGTAESGSDPGALGAPGAINVAGGTLTLNAAQITADTTFTPTTPIAFVNTQNTITGTPTINLNDDTTLENSDLDLPPTATFNLDPTAALTAQNSSSLTLHGDRTIPSTQAIHITTGSTFRHYGGFNVQGQLNIAGGTLNASTADNDLLPPAGQNAHHLTIDGGTFSTTTLTRFNPGDGADGPDGQNGGNGANIHLISGLLNIDGGTLLAPGGNGGNSNDEPGTGGSGGNGGNTTVSDGLLLSFNGTLNLAGGAGGIGETQAGSGGNAGNLNIDGGEATFNGGTIFMQGGTPETIIHGGDGGDGGNINVTGGNFFAGTTTINLKGRNGGNGDLSNGAPGNGGSLNITGGTTTFNFNTHVDMTPGNGGTRGQLNLTGGTLNLHEATLTGNNAVPAADPINLVGTTFNVTNTGHLNLTDTTRIADATLNHSDGTTIESISMNVVTGGTYNLNAGVLTGSSTPTVSADPITLFNTSVTLTGGDLNLNDNTTMNGGFLTRGTASDFNLAPNKRFTATNNAQIDLFDDILQIHENRTFEITNGSTLTVEIFLGVGLESSGTLLVDNATVQTGSAGPFNAPWGIGVGHADVTIRNNATANFNNHIEFVGSGAPGHSGTLRVQSGADMTVHNFDIASDSSGNATVLVDGPGTTFTQTGSATLELGASSSNTATLNVTNNAVFTTGTGPIDINPTGNLTIDTNATFNANAPTTVDGTINLTGGTMDATDITLNPSGTFNFTGGTLHVDNFSGTLNNDGGTLAPGHSPGITNITNDYNQAPTATLQIQVLNPTTPGAPPTTVPGSDSDQLNITANVTLAGTLDIDPLPDNGPITDTPLGTTFDILNYNTRTPDTYFDTITGTLQSTTFALAPLHNEFFKGILLRATIPGDLNLDNKVSVADLSTFALNFDTTPGLYNEDSNTNSWELGDFNTDGAITVADLSLLALNFGFELLPDGSTTSPTPLSIHTLANIAGLDPASIPEPTTLTLLLPLLLPTTRRPNQHHALNK